jgi:DNA polymerase III epsilon subunit-like protein
MNILFLDTETTGLDPENNRIIQIAARLDASQPGESGPKGVTEYFNTRVGHFMFLDDKPQFDVSLGALKVNKRSILDVNTNDMLPNTPKSDRIPHERAALIMFVDWLLQMNQKYGDSILCGHNVQFDEKFINSALKRNGISGLNDLVGYRRLDTASIAGFLRLMGVLQTEKSSLEETAKAMGITTEGLHDAKFDVDLTAFVLYGMEARVRDYFIKLGMAKAVVTMTPPPKKEREGD